LIPLPDQNFSCCNRATQRQAQHLFLPFQPLNSFSLFSLPTFRYFLFSRNFTVLFFLRQNRGEQEPAPISGESRVPFFFFSFFGKDVAVGDLTRHCHPIFALPSWAYSLGLPIQPPHYSSPSPPPLLVRVFFCPNLLLKFGFYALRGQPPLPPPFDRIFLTFRFFSFLSLSESSPSSRRFHPIQPFSTTFFSLPLRSLVCRIFDPLPSFTRCPLFLFSLS